MKFPTIFACLMAALVGVCVCPSSRQITQIRTEQGTWVRAYNGDVVNPDQAVVGAIDPLDGEKQYICRADHEDVTIPGKLSPMLKTCYIARAGSEHSRSGYEVLLNRDGYDLEWVDSSNGWFPQGAILGGYASGWPMLICRAWIRGRSNTWRWVSGKLDPEPGFECCYVPYAGDEHCEKNYQVLRNKD